jgi:hypothetical protein
MLVAVPVAMLALVVGIVLTLRALAPDEIPEADHDDYCDVVHGTSFVSATAQDDGVLVTWEPNLYDVASDYVVHRRPAGSADGTGWERVAEVTAGPVANGEPLSRLDTAPPAEPGTAYEYAVTHVFPECGGESEIPSFPAPPTATPPAG